MQNLFKKSIVLGVLFLVSLQVFGQFQIPEKPKLQTSLYDNANVLSKNEARYLEQKLIRYSDSTSTQIVVVTTPTINGENINLLAASWGQAWGVGQEKEDNGIFILLAKEDRKISIQTGYGIEHLLTDALSKRIIENIIIPEFKKGDYHAGLDKGTDVIFDVLTGEYQGNGSSSNGGSGFPPLVVIIIIIFILISVFSKKNRGGGRGGGFRRRSVAGDILTAIILSGAGRGGFGGHSSGGSFGSGGFGGGFGGGGFGGGGASGGW